MKAYSIATIKVHIQSVSYDNNNIWGAKYPVAVTSPATFQNCKFNKVYFEVTDQLATPNNIQPNTDVILYLTVADYFDTKEVLHVAEYQYA